MYTIGKRNNAFLEAQTCEHKSQKKETFQV